MRLRPRSRDGSPGSLETLSGNYRIIYRIDAKDRRVFVLAVVHGMQILRATMIQLH